MTLSFGRACEQFQVPGYQHPKKPDMVLTYLQTAEKS